MTDTTEAEIRDRFYADIRGAIDDCELLAKLPAQGLTFIRMRARLKAVENCCRQMAAWRGDTRWLPMCMLVEAAHQRSRKWIEDHDPRYLYFLLADALRKLEASAYALDTRATGRMGMILPEPLPGPHRETKPVQVLEPKSSIILPEGFNAG